MLEAAKGFRPLKAHKQLPILRAALAAHQAAHVINPELEQQANRCVAWLNKQSLLEPISTGGGTFRLNGKAMMHRRSVRLSVLVQTIPNDGHPLPRGVGFAEFIESRFTSGT